MKKMILGMLVLMSVLTFANNNPKSKTVTPTLTIYEPMVAYPQAHICNCIASMVYWNNGSACSKINCTVYKNMNGMMGDVICKFEITTCVDSPTFGNMTAPTSTPMPYEIDANIGYISGQEMTAEQLQAFQAFKQEGYYTIAQDETHTDADGNATRYKAGIYRILNSKLQVNISRVNL